MRAAAGMCLGISAVVIVAACTPTVPSDRGPDGDSVGYSPLLTVGQSIQVDLAGSQISSRFLAPAEHFIRISADTRGTDVEIALHGPEGQLSSILIPAWRWRPDVLAATSQASGLHEIRARAVGAASSPGILNLTLDTVRPIEPGDNARIRAQTAHARGVALAEFDGRKSESIEAFQAALGVSREAGVTEDEARELEWLGMVRTELSDYEGAVADLSLALSIYRQLESESGVADTLYRLGVAHREQGRFSEALTALDEAVQLFFSRGEAEAEALAHWTLGYARRRTADLQGALEHYRRAQEIYRQLGLRKRQPTALSNLGSIYQGLGEWKRARECFEEALPIARELGRKASEASILNNLGWGLKAQGRSADSLAYFQGALRIAEELDNSRRRSAYHENIARAFLELANPVAALPHARQSLALSRTVRDPFGEASSRLSLGLVLREAGLPKQSVQEIEAALAIYRDIGDRGREALAHYRLAESLRDGGDTSAAQRSIVAAREIIESVRGEVASRRLQATYLASHRAIYDFEVDLLVDLARSGAGEHHLAAALAAHERARARSFLDSLNESLNGVREGVEPALLAKEKALRVELNEMELRRQKVHGEDSGQLAAIDQKIHDLVAEIDLTKQTIRHQSPYYAELTQPLPLELESLQRDVLDDESLLLEYALGEHRSYLFAVTKNRLEVHELPSRRELESAAKRVYDLFSGYPENSSATTAAVLDASADVGQLLLGPVADKLADRRLILVTEGALQYVPFSALINPGDPQGRRLIVTNETLSLPSISSFAILRRAYSGRKRAPRRLAVLADPVFDEYDRRRAEKLPDDDAARRPASPLLLRSASESGFSYLTRLPKTRTEALALAEMVPPEERLIAVDFAASRELVLSGLLRDYQILHFATHGFLNSRNPDLSGLVLSLVNEGGQEIDGFLRLHDIYSLKLSADLVVLSACQTALGRNVLGEGLIGLVRGFMYSGARRVVASLWQVDDVATADLMQRFYRELIEKDRRPAAALRAAQIAMLEGAENNDWRHPFFWAAFTFQGEWE